MHIKIEQEQEQHKNLEYKYHGTKRLLPNDTNLIHKDYISAKVCL